MIKNPKDNENEDENEVVDTDAREVAETMDGYRDYMKEARGDSLTYGDY